MCDFSYLYYCSLECIQHRRKTEQPGGQNHLSGGCWSASVFSHLSAYAVGSKQSRNGGRDGDCTWPRYVESYSPWLIPLLLNLLEAEISGKVLTLSSLSKINQSHDSKLITPTPFHPEDDSNSSLLSNSN